jgi:hypothetical protein
MAYSADEYNIDTTIKVYNRSLQEMESRFTYYPEETLVGDNALIMYFNNSAFMFGKSDEHDARYDFIKIIEKCIEWVDVARQNNVRQLTRTVETDVSIIGVRYRLEPFSADFTFSIQEIQGRIEMMLIINYKTTYEWNNGSQGNYIVFREQDFNKLKEIFSDDYLLQFDDRATEQQRIEELFQ